VVKNKENWQTADHCTNLGGVCSISASMSASWVGKLPADLFTFFRLIPLQVVEKNIITNYCWYSLMPEPHIYFSH
jgi:hypothetical protein